MTRCTAVDQHVYEVAVVAVVALGGRRYQRYKGRTVEWSPFTVGVEQAWLGIAATLSPVLTTLCPLLLLLLSVPLLSLVSLLLVLGVEGAVFLNVAGTFAVVADGIATGALHRKHGGPAFLNLF